MEGTQSDKLATSRPFLNPWLISIERRSRESERERHKSAKPTGQRRKIGKDFQKF